MRGGGWVTMISHSVEILIAGGVGEMVRDPKSCLFFFFFYIYHAFIVFRYKKLCGALAMERTKLLKQNNNKGNLNLKVHHYVGALANRLPKPYK